MAYSYLNMLQLFGCCTLILAICDAASLNAKYGFATKDQHANEIDIEGERLKRGASALGLLLGKAIKIIQIGQYRLYMRRGGYKQAEADFESLGAKKVSENEGLRTGKAGNSDVYLSKTPWHGRLSILTYGTPGRGKETVQIDIIKYLE